MAEQIVSSVVSRACDFVCDKICDLLRYEYGLLGGLTDDVQKLNKLMDDFRKIAEEKGGKIFKSDTTKDWLFDVNRAVEEAERIVEEAQSLPPVCHSFPTACFTCFSVRERRAVGQTLQSILQKFVTLDAQSKTLNFEEIGLAINRETISTLFGVVVGRDDERENIIQVLLSAANKQSGGLNVYAIIGQGGIGKTTLAQLIFNDTRVKHHFKLTIWVWVSQTFQVKTVMNKIIQTLSNSNETHESLEVAKNRMQELLNGKRFLLVLDDIWNENISEWDQLKCSLNCGATASFILLTTRGSNVASIAGARVPDQFKIPVLAEDECWRVFKESAFGDENQENGVSLEMIGKQIAKKCGGLPLAAKSLGGSLRLIQEVCEWESVRDSAIWEQRGDILPALKLSLDRLETHSRNCFTFCCVFPKGYQMKKEELIQLWMANDFISSHPRLEVEEMGNKVFNDLVVKSFFQISDIYLEEVVVTMHDLMHDLCLYFRKECFCLEDSDIQIPPQTQHLFVDRSYPLITNLLETLSKSHSSLHTFISLGFYYDKKINFKPLNCLLVLSLMETRLEVLPISIEKVKDLKYLNLGGNPFLMRLPNSIGNLTKLQTLKLSQCESLTQLPEGITRLVNLRHLDLSWCKMLTHLLDGIGGLIQLRHLDLSGCRSLTHLPDGIGGLIQLRHLDLSECWSLTHLPDGIGGLMNLRHLDLSCRELEDFDELIQLPHDITGLVKIEHMLLQCCHQTRQLPNGLGQLVNLPALTLDLFVVGRDGEQRITELKRLNGLKGGLEIKGLENVRDATEATEAMLKEKNNLSSLFLIWGSSQGSDSSNDEAESPQSSDEAEAVLEALQPHQSLNNNLIIKGYGGSVFPTWMQLLHNLFHIVLIDCINCERLPPLGQLVHLTDLTITGMRSLKCIGNEFYGSSSGGRTVFPSLEVLVIEDMPKLEEWEDSQQTEACPCLEYLRIKRCESLKSLPECLRRNLSNLRELDIRCCDQLKLCREDFQSLISAERMYLIDLPKLTSFPALQHFSKLERLEIKRCKNLISLGPQGMMQNPTTVLERIWFEDCEQLELSSTDFQHLLKLKEILLSSLPKLTSLPDLQHLHSLEWIHISTCKNLKTLPHWLKNITSLRRLEIKGCGWGLEFQCAEDTFQHIPKVLIRSNSFVVGGEDGQRMTELKLLNGLKGGLEIKGLENVRDATEATEAMLKEKNNLSSLFLIWGSSQGSDSSNDEAESPQSSDEAEAVLEALQPPESLNKKLVIDGYGGSVFPTWMQLLHNLVEIELSDCNKCERLPLLGQLRHLEVLEIKGMRSLKCVDTTFYDSNSSSGGRTIFPSLVKLVISDMPKLEEWQEVQLKGNQKACPCLEQVKIERCKSLKSLPECLQNLSSLEKLDISSCDQLELFSADLISAKWMYLHDLPKLTSFPALQHFSRLRGLAIRGCKNLISLGPQGMMQNPTTVLLWISFEDCEQLELSSTDFQHLLEPQRIELISLPKLTSLPQLQHLPSLGELYIRNCENLKILPHWLQNITSLRSLEIKGCDPDLELQCAKDTGEYWPFIKHIQEVIIQTCKETPRSSMDMDMDDASTLDLV